MVTEGEAVSHAHYVAFLLWVVVAEHLEDLDLDLALLVKLLLVLKDLQGYVVSFLALSGGLVVDAANNHTESPAAKLLDDFVPVVDLVSVLNRQVVTVLAVKPIVEDLKLRFAAFLLLLRTWLLRQEAVEDLSFAIRSQVHVVNDFVLLDFVSLEGCEVLMEKSGGLCA